MPLYMAHTCPRAVKMSQSCGLRFSGATGQQQRSPLLARTPSSRASRAQRLSVQAGNTSGGPQATPLLWAAPAGCATPYSHRGHAASSAGCMRQALLVKLPQCVQHACCTTCSTRALFPFAAITATKPAMPAAEVAMGIWGTKAGMTQIFTPEGLSLSATVIALEDGNKVTQVRSKSCTPAMLLSLCQNQDGVVL